jgi:tetratricopeptide (TPR) repeat protein
VLQYTALTAQEEPDKALQCLEKAVQLAPRVLGPALQLATVYWQNRDHDKAMQFLHHYLTLVPESASAWQRLAEYQMEIGQWEQSRHSFLQALSFMPPVSQRKRLNILAAHDLGRVCTGLGTLYYRDNDKVQALKQAELWNEVKFVPELPAYLRVFKLRPGHVDTSHLLSKEKEAAQHAELADMLFQNHQIDDAIKEYRLAAALNPDDVDYHEFLLNALSEKGDWLGAASEDWAVSNKLLGKIPHAIGEMNKKKELPKAGDKEGSE